MLLPEADAATSGSRLFLEPEKLKHLHRVLRMEWDEKVLVLDGAGRVLEGVLEKSAQGGAIRLGAVQRTLPVPRSIELIIALPKNATMDWVVEKATECGATQITPVVSSRSIVKPDPKEAGKYVRRWQAIVDGAVEQSEQLWRPEVKAPVAWADFMASGGSVEMKSFAFVTELRQREGAGESEAEVLSACIQALQSARGSSVRIFIGPEGGFSVNELEGLKSRGFVFLSLGGAVLRVETATVAALMLTRVLGIV